MAFSFTKSLKRTREYDEDLADDLIDAGAWPRFLIVEGDDIDKPLYKLSPFAIQRGFQGISSGIKDIKKLKGGVYLVEYPTEKDF